MTPVLQKRNLNEKIFYNAINLGLSNIEACIIANRITLNDDDNIEKELKKIIDPKLKYLDSPFLLKDIDKASDRILKAIENNEIIALETDHDCDGQTSQAILYEGLTKLFNVDKDKIQTYIGHRINEGYGLSLKLANRMLNSKNRPNLVITADNGSTDEERIKILKDNNIDTIVTDHHTIPLEGIPKSAIAVINPTRDDCNYPDKKIAGCMVAWLLLNVLKSKIKNTNLELFDLRKLLDFVAVGTVADCVDLGSSFNNRAVVNYGLKLIKQQKRICWQVIEHNNIYKQEINSSYLGFTVGPLLNSDGRLGCATKSVSFLLEKDFDNANLRYLYLYEQNTKRKDIQKNITNLAIIEAKKQVLEDKKSTICIFLEKGHTGVHGISASRIKDMFGCPVIIFSPNIDSEEIISGSARSILEINLKDILDKIYLFDKTIFIKYGGHSAAAGMTIYKNKFKVFQDAFEFEVKKVLKGKVLKPIILVDYKINSFDLTLETVNKLKKLEPFGQKFEPAIFYANATLNSFKIIGKEKNHCNLFLNIYGTNFRTIWFNFDTEVLDKIISFQNQNKIIKIKFVFTLSENHFNNQIFLNIQIKAIENIFTEDF